MSEQWWKHEKVKKYVFNEKSAIILKHKIM